MDDEKIIELYFARSEQAVKETANKYGRYLNTVAHNILNTKEDCEECINDTYMRVWQKIPPERPKMFSAFLAKITRNLAINRYKSLNAKKRGSGQVPLVLDELSQCVADTSDTQNHIEDAALTEAINSFLAQIDEETRKIFMRRYWYMSTVKEIAQDFDLSESKVKMTLMRTRNKLKQFLLKEDIYL